MGLFTFLVRKKADANEMGAKSYLVTESSGLFSKWRTLNLENVTFLARNMLTCKEKIDKLETWAKNYWQSQIPLPRLPSGKWRGISKTSLINIPCFKVWLAPGEIQYYCAVVWPSEPKGTVCFTNGSAKRIQIPTFKKKHNKSMEDAFHALWSWHYTIIIGCFSWYSYLWLDGGGENPSSR